MNLILNRDNEVFFDNIKIGKIEIRNDKKCFISYATYEKHIYRKLNAWTVNSQVLEIPDLSFIIWHIPGKKDFGISIHRIRKFMQTYTNYLQGYKGYKVFEEQIAIPVSLCDSKIYKQDEVRKGITLDKFQSMIKDPHTIYHEWRGRKKGSSRSWSVG
jgi:hypothetical protein